MEKRSIVPVHDFLDQCRTDIDQFQTKLVSTLNILIEKEVPLEYIIDVYKALVTLHSDAINKQYIDNLKTYYNVKGLLPDEITSVSFYIGALVHLLDRLNDLTYKPIEISKKVSIIGNIFNAFYENIQYCL